MYRYLINLSYIGTPFRGLQRQVFLKDCSREDPTTVQGQIDIALRRLRSVNEPRTVSSSRTDSGVHAFHTTMHVDLQRQDGGPYEPVNITATLNQYFHKFDIPIRILKTYLVPNEFHCRFNAISRTYLYRVTVCHNSKVFNESMLHKHLPIQEFNRSLFISTNTFDVNKLKEAADLFVGFHDFRTFMHKSTLQPDKMSRRVLEKLEIQEGQALCTKNYAWPACVSDDRYNFKSYDVIIKASGFLQRQVRRTVASLIAVAKGIVTPKDIKFMLEIPSHRSWDPRIKTVPAQGLYLCEVAYSKNDLETFKEKLEK